MHVEFEVLRHMIHIFIWFECAYYICSRYELCNNFWSARNFSRIMAFSHMHPSRQPSPSSPPPPLLSTSTRNAFKIQRTEESCLQCSIPCELLVYSSWYNLHGALCLFMQKGIRRSNRKKLKHLKKNNDQRHNYAFRFQHHHGVWIRSIFFVTIFFCPAFVGFFLEEGKIVLVIQMHKVCKKLLRNILHKIKSFVLSIWLKKNNKQQNWRDCGWGSSSQYSWRGVKKWLDIRFVTHKYSVKSHSNIYFYDTIDMVGNWIVSVSEYGNEAVSDISIRKLGRCWYLYGISRGGSKSFCFKNRKL